MSLKGGAYTEVASATTLNTAETFLTHVTTGSQINLKAITRAAGATLDIGDATLAQTTTANVNSILGGWATLAGSDWAVSGSPIAALASYTGTLPLTSGVNTGNYTLTGPQTQSGAVLANTVKLASSGNGDTLALGANTLTTTYTSATSLGGILYVGGGDNNYNITGTGKLITSSTTGELIVNVNTGNLNISAPVVAAGATAGLLTKAGPGTLTLSGANTYTGATTVDAGTLALSGGSAIADATAIVLANVNGATLLLNNSETIGNLSGGGFSGGNVNVQANTLTLANANNLTFGGQITGTSSGGLTINSGTLTLANKNTFAGTITLAGTSQLTLTYGSDGTSNTPTISSGGTISMGGGTFLAVNSTAQVAAGVAVGSLGGSASVGDVVSNPIIVTSGTATIKQIVAGGPRYIFSGGVTGGTSGAQTLSIIQGAGGGNCERTTITVSGIIGDGSGGTLRVTSDFQSASGTGQGAFICLSGQNTFTGPIIVSNTKGLIFGNLVNNNGGFLVIGGEITSSFSDRTTVPGTGYLGGGNYANTISLATGTILNYMSSANQTLSGAISGGGNIVKEGTGTLTLTAVNTFSGSAIVKVGVLSLENSLALQNSWLDTVTSATGTASIGLQTAQAALTIGGLSGTSSPKNLASLFQTGGGYSGVSALTLNPITGSSYTYSGVIADGASGMTLTKTGAGTQSLSGANAYTGATAINGGTLQLGSGSTAGSLNTASAISVASGATFAISRSDTVTQGTQFSGAAITGAGGFAKSGTGTTILNTANSFTGPTTLNAGTLSVADASYLGTGNNVVFNGGTLQITGTSYTSISGGGHPFVFNPGAPVILDINNAANTFTFDQSLPPGGLALAGAGTVLFQDSVSVLTNYVASGVTATSSSAITDGTIPRSLIKVGAGTQVLQAANTYSGATTIREGTLTLNSAAGSLACTNIVLIGGTLTLDNSSGTGNAGNRVSDSAVVTLNASSGLNFTHSAAAATDYSETIDTLSLQSGFLTYNGSQAASGRTSGMNFNTLSRTGTAAVNFAGTGLGVDARNTIKFGAGVTAGQDLGPWAVVNGADFATYDATLGVKAASSTALAAGSNDATTNWRWDNNIVINTSLNPSYKTLFTSSSGAGRSLTLSGNTVSMGGISTTGNNGHQITGTGALQTLAEGDPFYINVGANALAINSVIQNVGAGVIASALVKSGTGSLTLSGVNTYSGGTVLNAGTLTTTTPNSNLGAGTITVNGPVSWSFGTSGCSRNLTINDGAVLSLTGTSTLSFSGVLSGNGTLNQTGSIVINFSNTGNTFTGPISIAYSLTFASLGDSSNPINFGGAGWVWSGGAKTFVLRPCTLNAGSGSVYNNGTGVLVIQQPLAITGAAGARTLSLGGSYATTANQFNGNIADGPGSVVSLTKAGDNSIWALSGTNTYTGATSTGCGGNPNNGFLILQGIQALSPFTSLNLAQVNANSAPGGFKILDDSATPASRSGVNLIYSNDQNNATDQRVYMSLFVGNNSTANGGTSSSTQTGSTIQLGNFSITQTSTGQTTGAGLAVTGANGYKLQINNVNITLAAAYASAWAVKLNPTTAPLTVTGNVQQMAGSSGTTTLQLDGTATGNQITGNIKDSADPTPMMLSVSKSSTSTWTLSGNNTFSGTTTVSGGTLVLAASTCLSDTNRLTIAGTGANKVKLNAGVREKVGYLTTNVTQAVSGTYGSSASRATYKSDVYFDATGTGVLYVGVDFPPQGTLIQIF